MNALVKMMWLFAGLLTVLVAVITAVVVVVEVYRRKKHGSRSGQSLEKRRAMHPPVSAEYRFKEPQGLIVGKDHGRYVCLPFKSRAIHQLIIAASGVGKTTTILSPLINHFMHHGDLPNDFKAVLAIDPKGELYKKCVDRRRADVKVIYLDEMRGWGFDVWYGLNNHSSMDSIMKRANQISTALIPPATNADNQYFTQTASTIMEAALAYGFIKGEPFCDTISRCLSIEVSDLISSILSDPDLDNLDPNGKIHQMLASYENTTGDSFESIKTQLRLNLSPFALDSINYCFGDNKLMVTPRDLINGTSVFINVPSTEIRRYSHILGLILNVCLTYLMGLEEREGTTEPPIWFLVEEGGNVYVPCMQAVTSIGASRGLDVSILAQNFAQLTTLYSTDTAYAIASNCREKIIMSCDLIADASFARNISSGLGTYLETEVTTSRHGISLHESYTTSHRRCNCIDPSDLMELPSFDETLVITQGKWFCVKKLPFYKIPKFAAESNRLVRLNEKNDGEWADL